MADAPVLVEEQIPERTERPGEFTIKPDQLAGSMFGIQTEQPKTEVKHTEQPKQETVQEPAKTEQPTVDQPKKDEEEVLDANEWLKREFNWESEDAAKAEIAELRRLREQPNEYKFENEESKKLADAIAKGDRKQILSILEKQDKIESFLTTEVNNNNAEDIIKLGMKLKYPDLTDAEINYKYNKQYSVPKEPVQDPEELYDDFAVRKQAWQEQVKDAEMSKLIDAKLVRPDLEQAKTKLVLPEIQQQPVQKQLTQEELDAVKKYEEAFNNSVDAAIKNFNGVSVSVKNEVVDFPVTFATTDEEKAAIAGTLKDFAKSNYDANVLFADRWVNQDGTLNTNQMVKDYHFLLNSEKAVQKIASDSANKAIEAYIKGKKNININETSQPGTAQIQKDDKTELDAIRDQFFR